PTGKKQGSRVSRSKCPELHKEPGRARGGGCAAQNWAQFRVFHDQDGRDERRNRCPKMVWPLHSRSPNVLTPFSFLQDIPQLPSTVSPLPGLPTFRKSF